MKPQMVGALLLALALPGSAQTAKSRENFEKMVKAYNFNLTDTDPKQLVAAYHASQNLDKTVRGEPQEYLPLLRVRLRDPQGNFYFRFDGARLLVSLDPSVESKKELIEVYNDVDFKKFAPRQWLETLAKYGSWGFDISTAATRSITDPGVRYKVEDSGFEVDNFSAPFMLFGSMSDENATPVLVKLINDPKFPRRDLVVSLLFFQTTSDADKALENIDINAFTTRYQKIILDFRNHNSLMQPRDKPLTTREEFLTSFKECIAGKPQRFEAIMEAHVDGGRDAVAVLKPEDMPLLRRMRRIYIARADAIGVGVYSALSNIIASVDYFSLQHPVTQEAPAK